MSNDSFIVPVPSKRPPSGSRQVIQSPEDLIISDGPVGEETAELLAEFLQPHSHAAPETLESVSVGDPEEEEERKYQQRLPWWKKPSPYWLLAAIPVSSMASTATIAPRVEIYRMLACSTHKPDIFREDYPDISRLLSFAAHALTPSGLATLPSTSPHAGLGSLFDQSFGKSQKCATDPVVTAAVATLIAGRSFLTFGVDSIPESGAILDAAILPAIVRIILLTSIVAISVCGGVLSVITTAWWGALSDRYGRVRVMGISIIGLLITDFTFILVTLFYRHLPGGYWLLVIGPTIEGLLGGYTTGVAAVHAYMADTTTEHTRSRFLSLNLGLMFSGMTFGPTIGSLLIRTFKNPLAVFYMATSCHLLYTFLVWFILPESVTQAQMKRARAKYTVELERNAPPHESNTSLKILYKLRLWFSFLSPLTIFWPSDKDLSNPLKRQGRDWNLTLMAVAYGFAISVMGSYQYKFQYASLQFGWSTEVIGYWLSLVSSVRAVFLAAILPLAIKLLKPKPLILELPAAPRASETTPLLSDRESSQQDEAPRTIKKEIHSPAFDLGLARFSLLVDIISDTFMAMAQTSLPFTTFSLVGALGGGFSPAMQSVTLALYTRRGGTETGRLFGALSVIQALCAQILGPALYGLVFVKTVTVFPSAIMFLTVLTVVLSFLALLLVKLPKRKPTPVDSEDATSPTNLHT